VAAGGAGKAAQIILLAFLHVSTLRSKILNIFISSGHPHFDVLQPNYIS
jgi:hypothetical protein